MLKSLLLALILICLSACDGGTRERKAARGENYVADPNYLYFKNTRQREYRVDDRGEAGNYFTHDKLYQSTASLIPVIYDNWLDDRAFLQLHTRAGAGPAAPSGPVTLIITSATGRNEVRLPARPDVAAVKQLSHHLNTTRNVSLLLGRDTLEAFPGVAREDAREVLNDYLRLID